MITILQLKSFVYKVFIKSFKSKQEQKTISNIHITEAEYYEEMFTRNKDWNNPTPNEEESLRWEKIKLLIENLPNSKSHQLTILDLGCGRGWLTNLLNVFGNVRGIEPVASVVTYGKKLFPHLKLDIGYAADLIEREPDTKFQLIVSSEVIEHVPLSLKSNYVQEIAQLLNKNGFVIITTPRAEAQAQFLQFAGANQPIEEWMSEAEVEQLFNMNGFTTIAKEVIHCLIPNSTITTNLYQVWCFKKS